jgi:hypothetical protein
MTAMHIVSVVVAAWVALTDLLNRLSTNEAICTKDLMHDLAVKTLASYSTLYCAAVGLSWAYSAVQCRSNALYGTPGAMQGFESGNWPANHHRSQRFY